MRRSGRGGGGTGREGQHLQKVAKTLGNQGVGDQLDHRSGLQAELLDEIVRRLEKVHGVQLHEQRELKDHRDWFKLTAMGTHGYHLPDPTRWHECTKVYMQAAQSLANGNLGQGARLMEKAADIEESTFATVPVQVQERLSGDEKTASGHPEAAEAVTDHMTAGKVSLPDGIDVGRKILNITTTMLDSPPLPKRHRWFDDLEEEEEEEEEVADG